MALKWFLILLGYLSSYGIWNATEAVDILVFMVFGGACFGIALYLDFGKRMR